MRGNCIIHIQLANRKFCILEFELDWNGMPYFVMHHLNGLCNSFCSYFISLGFRIGDKDAIRLFYFAHCTHDDTSQKEPD